MLNICNICLRTDNKLKISEDSLRNFHDELCDFEVDGYARFCPKCVFLLRKFYNFRNKCIKANTLLKVLEKSNKHPKPKLQDINKLHEKLPTSLGLSHVNSHTIYSYTSQAENVEQETVNNTDNSLTTNNNEGNDELILKAGFVIIDSTCPVYNKDVSSIFINKTAIISKENEGAENSIDKTYMNIDTVTHETKLETDNENSKRVSESNVNKTDRLSKNIESVNKTNESHSNYVNTELLICKLKIEKEIEDQKLQNTKATIIIEFDDDNNSQLDVVKIEQNNVDDNRSDNVDNRKLNNDDNINYNNQCVNIKNEKELKTKLHNDKISQKDDDNDNQNKKINKDKDNNKDLYINLLKARGKNDEEIDIDKIIEEALRSDSSDDEVLLTKKRRIISAKRNIDTEKKKEVSKKRTSKDIESDDLEFTKERERDKKSRSKLTTKRNLEETKRDVKKRLGYGDVKDKDGNVIDADIILNNLDTMVEYMYCKIKRYLAGNNPLSPEAIDYLGRTQKRYSKQKQYSNVFITKHLTTDEEIMEEFRKRETNKEYVECDHKCTQCFRHFKSGKMLKHHIKDYHDANKPHKCRYCEMRFDRLQPLCRHTQTHRVAYQCKLCPLVTSYISVMKSHYNYHKGVRYPCTKCSAVFKTPPVLAAHMNYVHQPDHVCAFCARKFYSKQGLLQHRMKKHHSVIDTVGPPSAKCEQCNIQFISDEVYLEHQLNSHCGPKKRRLIAGVDKSKKRKVTLNRRTPRFTCRVCKAVESSLGGLIWHFKSEHPSEKVEIKDMTLRAPYQYLCHECGKEFNNITTLTDHKNVHTGARPYACTECPKAFFYRTHLRNHLLFHLPPSKLCPHCGKAFRSNSNLCNHLRLHSGERRYACKTCGKTFLHQNAVTAHVRGVHLHIRRKRKHTQQHEFHE